MRLSETIKVSWQVGTDCGVTSSSRSTLRAEGRDNERERKTRPPDIQAPPAQRRETAGCSPNGAGGETDEMPQRFCAASGVKAAGGGLRPRTRPRKGLISLRDC